MSAGRRASGQRGVAGRSNGSQKEAARQIKTNGSWQAAQQKSAVWWAPKRERERELQYQWVYVCVSVCACVCSGCSSRCGSTWTEYSAIYDAKSQRRALIMLMMQPKRETGRQRERPRTFAMPPAVSVVNCSLPSPRRSAIFVCFQLIWSLPLFTLDLLASSEQFLWQSLFASFPFPIRIRIWLCLYSRARCECICLSLKCKKGFRMPAAIRRSFRRKCCHYSDGI